MNKNIKQYGFSLIEVLVTILILMVGLLGLAGLQGKALTAQLEAYQRSQALVLIKDMENRLNANRKNIDDYVTASALGVGAACPAAGVSIASKDLSEWCQAIMGAAEIQTGGVATGSMIGARGCIGKTAAAGDSSPAQYLVTIVWQGINKTAAPAVTCGEGLYGDESLRRALSLPVYIAVLD